MRPRTPLENAAFGGNLVAVGERRPVADQALESSVSLAMCFSSHEMGSIAQNEKLLNI
jgi:hypothetical protein